MDEWRGTRLDAHYPHESNQQTNTHPGNTKHAECNIDMYLCIHGMCLCDMDSFTGTPPSVPRPGVQGAHANGIEQFCLHCSLLWLGLLAAGV
jgi:hypothetical protein